jgi:TetR/AcrR family transcriptional repressor of nem operon
VAATGLQPGSLYAAFGSKKGVFLAVLDAYNADVLARLRCLGQDGRPAAGCIRELLETIVEDTLEGRNHQGCLAVNALLEMAAHEPDVAGRLQAHLGRVRQALAELIARAQADGDVSADRTPEAMAAFLVNNLWGMRVMCRGFADRESLAAVVEGILGALRK